MTNKKGVVAFNENVTRTPVSSRTLSDFADTKSKYRYE